MDGRALVIGGGAAAGNAWAIGVIAGLFDAGLDVTDADVIIGTSSGSTVAAQIAGPTRPPELLAAILDTSPPRTGQAPHRPAAGQLDHLRRMSAITAAATDPADRRRRLGAAALELNTPDDAIHARRATVAARLPSQDWPQRPILITAVDADTGEPVVFDRHSGVELADAITASTANGFTVPAHRIGDNHYLDGGYRRNENADLAAGYQRVLVLSPFGGRSLVPPEWGAQLAAQVDELRAGGSVVETIFPDGDAAEIFTVGGNQLDPATRPPAARAGHSQGKAIADQLTAFWR